MFLKTLPVVPVLPRSGALPQDGTVSSVFLPMVAEKGFGIPVRACDGDYMPALQRRLTALCGTMHVVGGLSKPEYAAVKNLVVFPSSNLRSLRAKRVPVVSDHMVTTDTAQALLALLLIKEEHDLESLGLYTHANQHVRLLKDDIPYLMLLHGLETMGALAAIQYSYNVFVSGRTFPDHADVRTIFIDRDMALNDPKSMNLTMLDVMLSLERGKRIDADAEPLKRYFSEAYHRGDPRQLRKLFFRANTAVESYVGGRPNSVAQVTVVKTL